LGRLVSYWWEVSIANSLPGPFVSLGMPPTNIVEESEQDLASSSGSARPDPEEMPDSYYINPSSAMNPRRTLIFR